MERLTYFENGWWRLKLGGTVFGNFPAVDRLAAYEDTGLEPGNIEDMLAAYEAACEELTECRMLREKHAPPCYSPDAGGGCRYQIYSDCNDEPIDKCKRCPLCYADKHRHQPPPNTPLTLEELREMDGEPVYDDLEDQWHVIEDVNYYDELYLQIVMTDGVVFDTDADGPCYFLERLYRRKPEEGTTCHKP